MSQSFFAGFPTITYGNNQVIDITERIVVRNGLVKNPYIYTPISIVDGVRADTVAYKAYGDPYTSWILYLTNNITDPYYEWYMNTDVFDKFIALKYGTIANAMQTIAYWTNNWVDKPQITVADYQALTANQQPFWTPNYGYYNTPISYSRTQVDWTASTNFILALGIGTGNTVHFHFNEPVFIQYNANTTGAAQVKQSNSSILIVQHITGNAFPGNVANTSNSFVYGTSSGANCVIANCTFLSNNILPDLQDYYAPVYYYDLENQINAGNRFINLLDPQYELDFVNTTVELLQSTNVAIIQG